MSGRHVVNVFEFDRFSGIKLDEVLHFESEREALEYCTEFNADLTEKVVPDWYMRALYDGVR